MAIDLDGSQNGLLRRLGKIAVNIISANSFRGTADLSAASIVSIGVGTDNVRALFNSSDQEVVDSLYSQRDAVRSSLAGWNAYQSQIAATTLITMANDDTPLTSLTTFYALKLLISQMVSANETVKANTVSASVATGSTNTGTAVCLASVKGPTGKDREYVIAEALTLTALNDSQSATATAGRESWSITGVVSQPDQLSWDWPKGSAVSTVLTAAAVDGSAQKLVNGDFEDFTTNDPDYWEIVVGTATTHIARAAAPFTGTYSLSFIGDGSTLTAIRQEFADSTNGNSYSLLPSTVYAFNCWVKMSATPGAGVLAATLTDSSGTTMTNDASASQQITKDLTGVSTSWVNFGGFFQTPSVLPSTPHYLKLHLTTALSSSRTLYIDDATFILPTLTYIGGPYLAVFPGATATVKNDTFSVTVANDWGGKFQKYFQIFFDLRNLGLQLPSSGSPTIDEALVS